MHLPDAELDNMPGAQKKPCFASAVNNRTKVIKIRETAHGSPSACQEVSARLSIGLPRRTFASEGPFSPHTSTSFVLVERRIELILESVFPVYLHCVGNCTFVLSNVVLLLSVDSILCAFFEQHLIPCDSCPLLLYQFFFIASKFLDRSF